jgi:hypothetical protein
MVITESLKICQILGIKCHNSEIVQSFCPETWHVIVETFGNMMVSTIYQQPEPPGGKLKN